MIVYERSSRNMMGNHWFSIWRVLLRRHAPILSKESVATTSIFATDSATQISIVLTNL